MTIEEQTLICRTIAKACMWGQGGVASTIINALQAEMPTEPSWLRTYAIHKRGAEYEAVGVVTSEDEVYRLLGRRYWLCNYRPGEISIFNPPPMNGLYKYVLGDLADKLGKDHDQHNWNVWQRRNQK